MTCRFRLSTAAGLFPCRFGVQRLDRRAGFAHSFQSRVRRGAWIRRSLRLTLADKAWSHPVAALSARGRIEERRTVPGWALTFATAPPLAMGSELRRGARR